MHKVLERFDTIDRLTPALRRVKKEVKKVLSQYPEFCSFGEIHWTIFEEVFQDLGFKKVPEPWDDHRISPKITFWNVNKKLVYSLDYSPNHSRVTIHKLHL